MNHVDIIMFDLKTLSQIHAYTGLTGQDKFQLLSSFEEKGRRFEKVVPSPVHF